MQTRITSNMGALALVLGSLLSGCESPPLEITQTGYRGTAMAQVGTAANEQAKKDRNQVPVAIPALPAGAGPKASEAYQNVQVLGDLSAAQFTRLMLAITSWVAPEQGCNYCHKAENFADDSLYTKVVARRMLQMTQHINGEWTEHVAQTGVTCYTCHRGQPVPQYLWFRNPGSTRSLAYAGGRDGQNEGGLASVAAASLPNDPFSIYLEGARDIRVHGTTALPTGNESKVRDAEHTYGLMMHMSSSLGVNCTFCHNSRAFAEWDQSTPQRGTAWYGIRMVRELNNDYLNPLRDTYPPYRLGALGDAPKVNCTTCHQGVNKPLYGVSMLADYPELGPAGVSGSAAEPTPTDAPAEGDAPVVVPEMTSASR